MSPLSTLKIKQSEGHNGQVKPSDEERNLKLIFQHEMAQSQHYRRLGDSGKILRWYLKTNS